jgi:hypothetical protein
MIIHFEGATGERRKELVRAISEAANGQISYKGAPSFDYEVGGFLIHKDGSIETDDFADPKALGLLLHTLRALGFIPLEGDWNEPETPPEEKELTACMSLPEVDGITLIFPKNGMDDLAVSNLKKLIEGKSRLIRMALEAEALPVEEGDGVLRFPWLPASAPSELTSACGLLIAALIKLAKRQRRVVLTETETDNPRYAFRCFLLRLGFIGDEYKEARKLLIKGIPGNGSTRHLTEAPVSPEN